MKWNFYMETRHDADGLPNVIYAATVTFGSQTSRHNIAERIGIIINKLEQLGLMRGYVNTSGKRYPMPARNYHRYFSYETSGYQTMRILFASEESWASAKVTHG